MIDDKNILQKIDELFYTKVPYQVYMIAAFICLVAVATLVSDYTSQEPQLNFTIDMSGYEIGGSAMAIELKQLYQGPVRPTDNEEYFRLTGTTKPREDKK
jgi:hypothetical protein